MKKHTKAAAAWIDKEQNMAARRLPTAKRTGAVPVADILRYIGGEVKWVKENLGACKYRDQVVGLAGAHKSLRSFAEKYLPISKR